MWEEMLSDEWQIIFNWGFEDEDYVITEDGRLNMTEEQYANTQNSQWKLANKADGFFQSSPKKQGWIMNDIQVGDKVEWATMPLTYPATQVFLRVRD